MTIFETTLAAMAAFYLVQPLVMHFLVINKPRSFNALALVMFLFSTMSLAHQLSLTDMKLGADMALLWAPFAMQMVKYVHAVAVGGNRVARQFNLTSFSRAAIYILAPPTVIFTDAPVEGPKGNTRIKGLWTILEGVIQLILAVTIVTLVLELRLDQSLPEWTQRVVTMYCRALCMGMNNILYDGPTRVLLGNRVMVFDSSNWPVLSTSQRKLWRRWSLGAGYLFRTGFYEPLGGRNNAFWATTVPFVVNCFIHVFVWGYWMQFRPVYEYVHLQITLPLSCMLLLEEFLLERCFKWSRTSWPYQITNYIALLISMCCAAHLAAGALLLPPDLRGTALHLLGRNDEI